MIEKTLVEEYKNINKNNGYKDLVEFHSRNKYLYFCYDIEGKDQMGKILANHEDKAFEEIYVEYLAELKCLLEKGVSTGRIINSLSHMMGYFKKELSTKEKESINTRIDNLKENPEDLPSLLEIIENLGEKYNKEYIKKQSIFALLEIE